MSIIFSLAAGGIFTKMIGILLAIRLGRLTRSKIETPHEWSFASNTGNSRSLAWLKNVSKSDHADWSRRASWALFLQQTGLYMFGIGWLGGFLGIVLGW